MKPSGSRLLIRTDNGANSIRPPSSPTGITGDSAGLDEVGPPPVSGIVVRDGIPSAWTWVDTDTGLRVVVGADMDDFCAGIIDFDVVDFQDATLSSGRIIDLGKGMMTTSVWDFLDFDCALFNTSDPVAYGRSRLLTVDNDLQGTVVNNTNTWGFMAQGRLMTSDGGTVQFNGYLRQQFGNDSGSKVVSKVQLK